MRRRVRSRRGRWASTIFGLQNSLKVYVGRAEALADKNLIAKKQAEEDDFRKKVAANPEWEKEYGERLGHDCESRRAGEAGIPVPDLSAGRTAGCSRLRCSWCSTSAEIKKPDGERLAQFHDANLQSLKFQLLSPAPIYDGYRKAVHEDGSESWRREAGQGRRVPAGACSMAGRSMRPWTRWWMAPSWAMWRCAKS